MEKKYLHLSDKDLLISYLDPKNPANNEPVGIWIDQKYFNPLWVYATYRLRDDRHRGYDALHDTAEKMCRWQGLERSQKFTVIPEQVLGALHYRVRDACHAISRRKSFANENHRPPEKIPEPEPEDHDLQEIQKMESRREIVKIYFIERGLTIEGKVAELIFIHGHRTRAYLIEKMGWNTKETHNMITKVKRHLRKLRLRDDQNPSAQ
jgi:hypothetical protein